MTNTQIIKELRNIFADAKACTVASYDELKGLNFAILEQNAILKASYKNDYIFYALKTEPYYGLVIALMYNNNIIYLDEQIHYNHYKGLKFIDRMIKTMNYKTFSINELLNNKIKDYSNYYYKSDFIRNCLADAFSSVSMFHIGEYTPQEQITVNKGLFSRSCFKYFDFKSDLEFIDKIYKINEDKYKAILKDLEFFRDAIRSELANHEAGYTMYYESIENSVNALGLKMDELTNQQKKILNEELNKLAKASW